MRHEGPSVLYFHIGPFVRVAPERSAFWIKEGNYGRPCYQSTSDYKFHRARREADAWAYHIVYAHEARVLEVGLVASSKVAVIAVVEPSSFFTVRVVPEILNSMTDCIII